MKPPYLTFVFLVFLALATAFTGRASVASEKKKSPYEEKDGRVEAKHDISAGRLAFKTTAPAALGAKTFERLLKEKYGIETDVIDGDETDDAQVRYLVSYNFEMRMFIEQKIPDCTRTFRLLFEECVETEKKEKANQAPEP